MVQKMDYRVQASPHPNGSRTVTLERRHSNTSGERKHSTDRKYKTQLIKRVMKRAQLDEAMESMKQGLGSPKSPLGAPSPGEFGHQFATQFDLNPAASHDETANSISTARLYLSNKDPLSPALKSPTDDHQTRDSAPGSTTSAGKQPARRVPSTVSSSSSSGFNEFSGRSGTSSGKNSLTGGASVSTFGSASSTAGGHGTSSSNDDGDVGMSSLMSPDSPFIADDLNADVGISSARQSFLSTSDIDSSTKMTEINNNNFKNENLSSGVDANPSTSLQFASNESECESADYIPKTDPVSNSSISPMMVVDWNKSRQRLNIAALDPSLVAMEGGDEQDNRLASEAIETENQTLFRANAVASGPVNAKGVNGGERPTQLSLTPKSPNLERIYSPRGYQKNPLRKAQTLTSPASANQTTLPSFISGSSIAKIWRPEYPAEQSPSGGHGNRGSLGANEVLAEDVTKGLRQSMPDLTGEPQDGDGRGPRKEADDNYYEEIFPSPYRVIVKQTESIDPGTEQPLYATPAKHRRDSSSPDRGGTSLQYPSYAPSREEWHHQQEYSFAGGRRAGDEEGADQFFRPISDRDFTSGGSYTSITIPLTSGGEPTKAFAGGTPPLYDSLNSFIQHGAGERNNGETLIESPEDPSTNFGTINTNQLQQYSNSQPNAMTQSSMVSSSNIIFSTKGAPPKDPLSSVNGQWFPGTSKHTVSPAASVSSGKGEGAPFENSQQRSSTPASNSQSFGNGLESSAGNHSPMSSRSDNWNSNSNNNKSNNNNNNSITSNNVIYNNNVDITVKRNSASTPPPPVPKKTNRIAHVPPFRQITAVHNKGINNGSYPGSRSGSPHSEMRTPPPPVPPKPDLIGNYTSNNISPPLNKLNSHIVNQGARDSFSSGDTHLSHNKVQPPPVPPKMRHLPSVVPHQDAPDLLRNVKEAELEYSSDQFRGTSQSQLGGNNNEYSIHPNKYANTFYQEDSKQREGSADPNSCSDSVTLTTTSAKCIINSMFHPKAGVAGSLGVVDPQQRHPPQFPPPSESSEIGRSNGQNNNNNSSNIPHQQSIIVGHVVPVEKKPHTPSPPSYSPSGNQDVAVQLRVAGNIANSGCRDSISSQQRTSFTGGIAGRQQKGFDNGSGGLVDPASVMDEIMGPKSTEKLKVEEAIDKIMQKLHLYERERVNFSEQLRRIESVGANFLKELGNSGTDQSEVNKVKRHMEEAGRIVCLQLRLAGQLERVEHSLRSLPESCQESEQRPFVQRRARLRAEMEDAQALKIAIEAKSKAVVTFLNEKMGQQEVVRFCDFMQQRERLLLDNGRLEDRIRLGEERIKDLRCN